MALPFLPAKHIVPSFNVLAEKEIPVETTLVKLVAYFRSTWITSSLWSPGQWSVFCETVRTNNDVEGSHRKLNTQAQHGHLLFYQLVDLQYRESRIVDVQVLLVAEHKLRRYQRLTCKDVQGRGRTPARPLG